MCNISAWWYRESKPSFKLIQDFFEFGKTRGTDGFGIVNIYYKNGKYKIGQQKKIVSVEDQKNIVKEIHKSSRFGDILVANNRAAPETEPKSKDKDSIQPIINLTDNLVLVHNGAVSNQIYKEMLEVGYPKFSELDSEAIIWAYLHHQRDIVETMKYLSGGFSLILFDKDKQRLFVSCTHNPLYCGYVRGYGMMWNSQERAIWDSISKCKKIIIEDHNLSVFEDFYVREIKENTIEEIDLSSGMINNHKFEPRYITLNWDPYKKDIDINRPKYVLVASSGGLDSTTTLVTLKEAGYKPIAVHFKYGHRGGDAEYIAIKNITEKLKIDLEIFDISENIKRLDEGGMLTDPNAPITTGTEIGLKTTAAWTTWRNGFFLSYMAALSENLILKHNLPEVFITGGFMNLTESSVFGDNSERFLKSFIKFNTFASIVGSRVKPLYGLCNILKTEQYILLNSLGWYEKLGKWLISCDRPKLIGGDPYNCRKDGKPACGSGLLSWWACKMANLEDRRTYYEIEEDYEAYIPPSDLFPKFIDIQTIINKLELHKENLKILRKKFYKGNNKL